MLFEEKHSKHDYYCTLHYENMICIPHLQSSFEMLFVTGGSIEAVFQDRTIRIFEGQCVWVLPYEIHWYKTDDKSSVFIAIFSTDLMEDFYQSMIDKQLQNPVVRFEDRQLEALKSNDAYLRKAALYELCSAVSGQGAQMKCADLVSDTATRIMLYIQENFQEQITLKDLAVHLGYSYSYTSSLMNRCFHKSISDLVNEHRMDYALKRLRAGGCTMTEIAERSGFSTIRNFNMAFKKAYDISPTEYQKKYCQQKLCKD